MRKKMLLLWKTMRKHGRHVLYTVVFVYTVYVMLFYAILERFNAEDNEISDKVFIKEKYIIDTPGCRIEHIDAFNPEIKKLLYKIDPITCSDKPLLTYISRVENKVSLNINKTAANIYYILFNIFNIKCFYQEVTRNPIGPTPDDNLNFSDYKYFRDSVQIQSEVVKVECFNIFYKVYENVHAIFRQPAQTIQNVDKPNVILLGIDSISMSNLIRTMPKTYELLETTKWIRLTAYNKVEDNTFPNLIAVLAGVKFSYHENLPENAICNPYDTKSLNNCNFLWNVYKENNYSTVYAEDTPEQGTFNSNKAGFVSSPTDYYLRPYFLTVDTLTPKFLCLKSYCTGPEKTGVRMQNLVIDFIEAIKGKTPGFGLFWMNTFSHENVNCPSSMDDDFELYFKKLAAKGHMDDSIIIFFSDHGFRFGKIRLTPTGWLEERLPFMYIWVPERFRMAHAESYQILAENSKQLTSPYDIYMTLQDLLSFSNPNFTPQPAKGCSTCHSLFKPVSPERTCKEAGIPEHYCTCSRYEKISKDLPMSQKISEFFVEHLNKIIRSYGSVSKGCATYSLEKISHVKYLQMKPGVEENYLIGIITNPEANFEATVKVSYQNNKVNMSLKEINRLDRYAPTSYCAVGSPVQMYCYCKTTLKRMSNIFCNNKYCFL
ncbi:uncharacterized protein LOC126884531 [Diabrotica virgifera virgifera]|uniref:Uncharacterized protein n=1 Tax=Diabrotica virgifera virgifera TaxID=50390 RepID=A0ABM5K8C0_DIAVI|nr:uncharacterized protein LOC126884531 [Diabrotica virgifera virgifera]